MNNGSAIHKCLHEADIAKIVEKVGNIEIKQDRLINTMDKIFNRLEGKNGLTSEVAILKTKLNLIPSFRTLIFYSSVGGALAVIGFMFVRFIAEQLFSSI
jgi:hypothetical protein